MSKASKDLSANIKGSSTMKASFGVEPGDITVNYFLAAFSFILAPVLTFIASLKLYVGFHWYFKLLVIVATVLIAYFLVIGNPCGRHLVDKLVRHIKRK